jgi:drug/metabolite transporter (DMT)-like permease
MSVRKGAALLLLVALGWGLTWPLNKALLESLSPFWLAALRAALAALTILALVVPRGRLALPPRSDLPVLLSITLLHMVGFVILANIGLQLVPVGRSVVLAYTTPLWVMPGAAWFLGERLTARRIAGMALGMLGLGVLFNPFAFDWSDRNSILGHAALLLAALLWAASILHIRGHRWTATPFQLLPWETLLAAVLLFAVALGFEPQLEVQWSARLVLLLVATSTVGVVVPYWAAAAAGRALSAGTVSLGVLGAPLVAILSAAALLGEVPGLSVWIAVACVLGGVALGTTERKR